MFSKLAFGTESMNYGNIFINWYDEEKVVNPQLSVNQTVIKVFNQHGEMLKRFRCDESVSDYNEFKRVSEMLVAYYELGLTLEKEFEGEFAEFVRCLKMIFEIDFNSSHFDEDTGESKRTFISLPVTTRDNDGATIHVRSTAVRRGIREVEVTVTYPGVQSSGEWMVYKETRTKMFAVPEKNSPLEEYVYSKLVKMVEDNE